MKNHTLEVMSKDFDEFKLNDKTYRVKQPSLVDSKESSKVRNKTFVEMLDSGSLLRAQLSDILIERKIWTDEKERDFNQLRSEILEKEKQLEEGGIRIDEARAVAIEIKQKRSQMSLMLIKRSTLDNETVEGQADNMAFNYLVSACTFLVYDNSGEPHPVRKEERVFSSLDDYLEKSTTEIGFLAAQKLSSLTIGIGDALERKLPENQFLVEYGFVDDQLRYINEAGHLTDEDGKLVNDRGQYVNDKDQIIDINGNIITEDGHYQVEKKPFVDKNGQPIEKKINLADSDSDDSDSAAD